MTMAREDMSFLTGEKPGYQSSPGWTHDASPWQRQSHSSYLQAVITREWGERKFVYWGAVSVNGGRLTSFQHPRWSAMLALRVFRGDVCVHVCDCMCMWCEFARVLCVKLGSLSKSGTVSDFILKVQRMLAEVTRLRLCLLIRCSPYVEGEKLRLE